MSKDVSTKKYVWVITVVAMLALSLAVVYLSRNYYIAELGKYDTPVEVAFTVASVEDIDISGMSADKYDVRAAQKAFDQDGNLVAYVIESTAVGFNSAKEIVVASTITADGSVLAGINVLEQSETEYFGARISTTMFTDRFTGRYLPVMLTGESGRGAHVDALSKSTISSTAVVKAVDNAYEFLKTEILNEN